jgi:hypothetical protein
MIISLKVFFFFFLFFFLKVFCWKGETGESEGEVNTDEAFS